MRIKALGGLWGSEVLVFCVCVNVFFNVWTFLCGNTVFDELITSICDSRYLSASLILTAAWILVSRSDSGEEDRLSITQIRVSHHFVGQVNLYASITNA